MLSRAWFTRLGAQPVFCGWVRRQLSGTTLLAGNSPHDAAHAAALAALVRNGPSPVVPELELEFKLPVGTVQVGNLKDEARLTSAADGLLVLCRDFQRGQCQRGTTCRFAHAVSKLAAGAAVCVDRSTALGNPFKMGLDGKCVFSREGN